MDSNFVYFEIKNKKLAEITKNNKIDLAVSNDIIYSNGKGFRSATWLEIGSEGYIEEQVKKDNLSQWFINFLGFMGDIYYYGFSSLSRNNVAKAISEIQINHEEIDCEGAEFVIKLCYCSAEGGENGFATYSSKDNKFEHYYFYESDYYELVEGEDRPLWQITHEIGPEGLDKIFNKIPKKSDGCSKKKTDYPDDMFDNVDNIDFSGKLFCFTGFEYSSRDLIGRNELVDAIIDFGSDVRSNVSSKVDYLVVDNYIGAKYYKAKELQNSGGKIKIITRGVFEEIVCCELKIRMTCTTKNESSSDINHVKVKKKSNESLLDKPGSENINTATPKISTVETGKSVKKDNKKIILPIENQANNMGTIISSGDEKVDMFYGFNKGGQYIDIDNVWYLYIPESFDFGKNVKKYVKLSNQTGNEFNIQPNHRNFDITYDCVSIFNDKYAKIDEPDSATLSLTCLKLEALDRNDYDYSKKEVVDKILIDRVSSTRYTVNKRYKKVIAKSNLYIEFADGLRISTCSQYHAVVLNKDNFYSIDISFEYDDFTFNRTGRGITKLTKAKEESIVKSWLKTVRLIENEKNDTVELNKSSANELIEKQDIYNVEMQVPMDNNQQCSRFEEHTDDCSRDETQTSNDSCDNKVVEKNSIKAFVKALKIFIYVCISTSITQMFYSYDSFHNIRGEIEYTPVILNILCSLFGAVYGVVVEQEPTGFSKFIKLCGILIPLTIVMHFVLLLVYVFI